MYNFLFWKHNMFLVVTLNNLGQLSVHLKILSLPGKSQKVAHPFSQSWQSDGLCSTLGEVFHHSLHTRQAFIADLLALQYQSTEILNWDRKPENKLIQKKSMKESMNSYALLGFYTCSLGRYDTTLLSTLVAAHFELINYSTIFSKFGNSIFFCTMLDEQD